MLWPLSPPDVAIKGFDTYSRIVVAAFLLKQRWWAPHKRVPAYRLEKPCVKTVLFLGGPSLAKNIEALKGLSLGKITENLPLVYNRNVTVGPQSRQQAQIWAIVVSSLVTRPSGGDDGRAKHQQQPGRSEIVWPAGLCERY
jgi:hypothetical protein